MSKTTRKYRKHGAARGSRTRRDRVRMQPAGKVDPYQAMKAVSRSHLRQLWESDQHGEPLEGEEARMVQVMREHPEYAALWPRLDELTDAELEQGGVNPLMHIMIHTTLENQLAENNPPATGEALEALMAQGLSRHEALHRMGGVLTDEIFGVLQEGRPFDAAGYDRKLRELTKDV
ncbi:MAG: DUF1841 family protein [Chloroflexota bacterium]|nr:DUF1841 family protein [Chloroflexota bacterium]